MNKIEYDIIYRYCEPSILSGDGKEIRSRNNNELIFSLISLKLLDQLPSDIFIIHKGSPPNIDFDSISPKIYSKITFIEESKLFNSFYNEYGIMAKSRNSEPCKMGFQYLSKLKWGFQKSPYFLSVDDDYIIRQNVIVSDVFFGEKGLPAYPKKIKGCHCPLMFKYSDYTEFIHNLSNNKKLKYIQSDRKRIDLFQEYIPTMLKNRRGIVKPFNKSFIGHRYSGIFQFLILYLYFAWVNLTKKQFVCINDNWDTNDFWYNKEMDVYKKWFYKKHTIIIFIKAALIFTCIVVTTILFLLFIFKGILPSL